MYAERFRFLYYCIAAIATAGVCAILIGPVALGDPVRVQTEYRDAPALSSSSSVASARERLGKPTQTVDGEQLGLPAGSKCDVYELSDGISLLCYQG